MASSTTWRQSAHCWWNAEDLKEQQRFVLKYNNLTALTEQCKAADITSSAYFISSGYTSYFLVWLWVSIVERASEASNIFLLRENVKIAVCVCVVIAIQTKGLSISMKFYKQVFATFEFVFRQNSFEPKMAAILNTISLKAHSL